MIMKAFPQMEFVEKGLYEKKPKNNIAMPKRPEIMIKLQFWGSALINNETLYILKAHYI